MPPILAGHWQTGEMRLLASRRRGIPLGRVSTSTLDTLYTFPRGRWVRANFVATVDGSAVGSDGLSGTINTTADKQVFARLRVLADVILVGAGTARAEGYGPARKPIAVVSRAGHVPQALLDQRAGRTILITCASSGRTESDDVWLCGEDDVELAEGVARLVDAGMPHILCEGGPHLFGSLLEAGLVDDLAATTSPKILAGEGLRMAAGAPAGVDVETELRHLLEEDGTLLALWRVKR
jgi:riboflavin biosynthesis pyrimidine reductase